MINIGIFDSGMGGLSILKEILTRGFAAEFYYLSDTDHVPYGNKTQDFMLERSKKMMAIFERMQIKTIILACNTLTAQTIDELRDLYPSCHLIGIEPYLNILHKFEFTQNDHIALVLTPGTYHSSRFKKLRQELDPNSLIQVYPLEKMALLIEKRFLMSKEEFDLMFEEEIKPLKNQGFTHLILGCTHYSLVENLFRNSLDLKVIDPNKRIVKHLKTLMNLKTNIKPVDYQFYYNSNMKESWKKIKIEDVLKDLL